MSVKLGGYRRNISVHYYYYYMHMYMHVYAHVHACIAHVHVQLCMHHIHINKIFKKEINSPSTYPSVFVDMLPETQD